MLYYGYALSGLVGAGTVGAGVDRFCSTLLGGRSGLANPTDADLRAMLTEADRWSRYGLAVGGDLKSDGTIDSDDVLVLYYSRSLGTLLGDGSEDSGSERFRSSLLGSRTGLDDPRDDDLRTMLRRAGQLDFSVTWMGGEVDFAPEWSDGWSAVREPALASWKDRWVPADPNLLHSTRAKVRDRPGSGFTVGPEAGGDDSPDLDPGLGVDRKVREVRVVRAQDAVLAQALDAELAVDGDDHDVAGLRVQGPVHDQQVAVKDAGVAHGLAPGPDEERGRGTPGQVAVQVEVVIGGARESRGDRVPVQGQREVQGGVGESEDGGRHRFRIRI